MSRNRDDAGRGSQLATAPAAAGLLRFLRRARSAASARVLRWALVDAVLAICATVLVAAGAAAWSLRGDLAAAGAQGAAVVAAGIIFGVAWAKARRRWGTRLRTARTIASTGGPLRRLPCAAEVGRADRLLRHEVLGALELLDGLGVDDAPPAGDDALVPLRRRPGSEVLARRYVDDVSSRVSAPVIDPHRALPRPRAWPRAVAAAASAVFAIVFLTWAPAAHGLGLLLSSTDGRPKAPPEPVWSSLSLTLEYPEHTQRPHRAVPNPSGALRVPAGTTVQLQMTARHPAQAGRVVLTYDPTELTDAHAPEIVELQGTDEAGLTWSGAFEVRGTGSWTLVLLDDDDDIDSSRRSAALPLQLEPDRAPEVELLPLPRAQREVRETDRVDVRFHARDDFGVVSGELVYQLPDGETHRSALSTPPGPSRTWRHRHTWDISDIPISERSEVLYWVEVRDNDPGLGLDPLPDGPGKVTRSATMRLVINDDEAEHAANIVKLRDIRDAAVDLLAVRMTTRAFGRLPASEVTGRPVHVRAAEARAILHRGGELLAMLADAIDALSMDTLARERDVATLTEIHGRLMKLHRKEIELHEGMPPGSERLDPAKVATVLSSLHPHNVQQIERLEDEIIRLDDLVDGQIIERLEALVARLEATQRKLVELLEQLKAGDESVRAQIDQLEQRRREDLRRIAEARAMLRKEIEQEFMNTDAFEILEQMAQREQLSEMLRRGEVDEALERARGQLGEVQNLRDEVQQRVGDAEGQAALSEEERKRMQLLRELSRLQDEQATLRSQTRELHETWRASVGDREANAADRRKAEQKAESLLRSLEEINDARLGREGRRGLEDAKSALQRLQAAAERDEARELELTEAAEAAAEGLRRAESGSETSEAEGKAVRRGRRKAEELAEGLRTELPSPQSVLKPDARSEIDDVQQRQQGLRKRADALMQGDLSQLLPSEGRRAMRSADDGMQDSVQRLGAVEPGDAVGGQSRSWQSIQDAIDSLRRGSPPPPPPSASGDASTEAERDRSLRDALMDAMREGAPRGFDESVKRYYQELLR